MPLESAGVWFDDDAIAPIAVVEDALYLLELEDELLSALSGATGSVVNGAITGPARATASVGAALVANPYINGVPMSAILYKNNDNLIELRGLTDTLTNLVLNAATVTAQVEDMSGVVVVASFPVPTAGSSGNYRTVLDKTAIASLVLNNSYITKYTAVQGTTDYAANFQVVFQERVI